MAIYGDLPDGARSRRLFVDARTLPVRQRIAHFLGLMAWLALTVATTVSLADPADRSLDRARAGTRMASLWFRPDGPVRASIVVPLALGLIVLMLDLRAVTKVTLLALLYSAMMIGLTVAQRGYTVVTDDQVLIHPALPWRHDVRFALSQATVTERGCNLWHSRSGAHRQIIFKVRAPDGGGTVDLGEAAGRNIGAWLTVMRDYDNGYVPFPAQAGVGAPHDPDCLRYWADGLPPQQAAELSHLLG